MKTLVIIHEAKKGAHYASLTSHYLRCYGPILLYLVVFFSDCPIFIVITHDTGNTDAYNAQPCRFQVYKLQGHTNDHPYYIGVVDDSDGIWFCGSSLWMVGPKNRLGDCHGGLYTADQSSCPADTNGWMYSDGGWKDAGRGVVIETIGIQYITLFRMVAQSYIEDS